MANRAPNHTKQALANFVNSSRANYKAFRQSYGAKVIGESTIDQVLTASSGIPVLFTPRFHSSSSSNAAVMSVVHNCLAEQVFERLKHMENVNNEAAAHDNNHLKSVPLEAQYSLQLLKLQPQSAFYNYRHTLLKTTYWELVWEDIVDICALSMVWQKSHNNFNSFDPINTPKTILDDLRSTSIADDDPQIHTLRLVSSTLSDPFLASSSMLNGMKATEYKTKGLFLDDVRRKLLHGLLLVWMDRVLMLPLSNPKSIDLASLQEFVAPPPGTLLQDFAGDILLGLAIHH